MRKAIGDFADKLNSKGPDTIALVYYAGHGLQVDGENFLLPVDVTPQHEADIPLQGVRLNDLLNSLVAVPSKMRIIMLDSSSVTIRSRNSRRRSAKALRSLIPNPDRRAPLFRSRRHRARSLKTAPAPTVPTRRRFSSPPASPG